jgi:3-phosphoshikimate 1-carboxyvinyltransferase
LIVAALAEGPSVLVGALDSDDTRVMIAALRALGITVEHDPASCKITVDGCGGTIPARSASLQVANSGTSLRFLTALLATGHGTFHLDGSSRMRQRPVSDLLEALNELGCRAQSDHETGCPPVTIESNGLRGGHALIRGDVSSQFLSGLLMALPSAEAQTTIEVKGQLVSQPYVAMTLAVMEAFGVSVARDADTLRRFEVTPAHYRGRTYAIEPDASAASYFWALAAITGGEITVSDLGSTCLQGDVAFVDALEQMGCSVVRQPASTTLKAGALQGIDIDMNAISDTVMTLAVVALFARGPTRIRNVSHIRHKETDRIAALATELRQFGARAQEYADGLVIDPPPLQELHGARIATYDDHRMAMSFALAGLRIPGVTILDPGCVAKTYPGFWDDLERLRSSVRV